MQSNVTSAYGRIFFDDRDLHLRFVILDDPIASLVKDKGYTDWLVRDGLLQYLSEYISQSVVVTS